jgi:NAD(P)-dependent dehydrogenase (short-subunit alcohol dehydrogenase family)
MDSLSGHRCVVTGGSLGIGAAITRGLLVLGAEVTVACRDVARARQAHDELAPAEARARLSFERLDVSNLAEVRAFADRLRARWSRLDVLVNNAGASYAVRRLSADGHELTFATNVLGPFALTRALRPLLRRAEGRARIVHVGSLAQYLCRLHTARLIDLRAPYLHGPVYAHSKRAQFELSERWAEVLDEEGITSTCAHPGLVATPGVREAFPLYYRVFGGVLWTADAGADTAVWLASSAAVAGVTGGLWWMRAPQPADVLPFTRAPTRERDRLWDLCARLASGGYP